MATTENRVVLSELITTATIELNLKSNQRDEVLAEMVRRIPELADRPGEQKKLLHALIEREGLHSTGIGDGIALPHARNALVGIVDRPVIVFGRHAEGVQFAAIDGEPARLFFLLVAPTVSQHLHILARISRLLRVRALRKQLLEASSPEEVLKRLRDAEAQL